MKKCIAVLMAVLMMFSCTVMLASAEDTTVVEEPTEPATPVTRYEICEDADFRSITFMEAGNDAATLLKPGDIVFSTYSDATGDLNVWYYADADGQYKGNWQPADSNNLAFSISGKPSFSESFGANANKEAVVRGLDSEELPMDFTIAYPEENVFLGWVVYDYDVTTNTIKLCGVWEKNHKIPVSEETDDFYYILDFFFGLRQKIVAPFANAVKYIANAILAIHVALYDMLFGEKTAA